MKQQLHFFKRLRVLFVFFGLMVMPGVGWGQTSVFSDDFSANQSATWTTSGQIGSSDFYVNRSGADWGARRNTSPAHLELTNDIGATANVAGWAFANVATSGYSSPYNTTLSSNTGLVTWHFNIRQIRTDPAGYASGSYAAAFILATTSQTANNAGTGYAIVYGQSGSTDPIRLAKFSGGLSTGLTNIITSNTTGLTDFGAEYLSVKVTYLPSTNTWELFLRNDGASAFADPITGSLTSQGTAVDNTYTSTSLAYMGGYWQGSTGANLTAFFDNITVQVTSEAAVAPTTQATNITFSSIGQNAMTANWTNGDGAKRVVIMNTINSFTAPADGADPTANTVYGSGQQVVFNGSGNSVAVTGLIASTTYWFRVYEYNGSGATTKYLTFDATDNPKSQATTAPVPLITLSTSTLTGFTYVEGAGPSTEQTFTVSGSNLTHDISIAATTNYEISKSSGSGYTTPLTFTPAEAATPQTVYVRLKAGLSAGSYNGELISATSTGAADKTVTCSGSVSDPNLKVEDFVNSNATTSYSNGSFVGNNGITWTYVQTRDANNDANGSGIDLPAIMLRRVIDNSSVYSSSISGGIGSFSVKLYKGFTGAGSRQVELFINDVSKGISTSFDDYNEHIFEVTDINITGDIVIRINNITANQVIVDDISWTGYSVPGLWKTTASTSDWATGSNWDDGNIPTSEINVNIPAGALNNPIIAGEASCNNLTVEGSLTIKSDESGTGSLKIGGTYSGTGTFTTERYIDGYTSATNGWHLLSTPTDNFIVAGSNLEPSSVQNEEDDLYYWDNAQGDAGLWMNWKAAPFNLLAGKGYLTSYKDTEVKSFAGAPYNLDKTFNNLSFLNASPIHNNTWHLLGNPFTCALIWNNSNGWALSNIGGVAKVLNVANGSYLDINAGGAIPAMQGFFVEVVSASNSITIPLEARQHNSQDWYKSTSDKIILTANDTENNLSQQSVIRTNSLANEQFDFRFDSRFLGFYAPQFYSNKDGQQLSTNTLPQITEELVIPFGFTKNVSSNFSIELAETIENQPIFLTDLKTNTVQKLSENPIYTFTSAEGDDPNRFLLHFGAVGVGEQSPVNSFRAYALNGRLYFQLDGTATMEVIDIQGRLLESAEISAQGLADRQMNLPAGVYVVRLTGSHGVQTAKVVVK